MVIGNVGPGESGADVVQALGVVEGPNSPTRMHTTATELRTVVYQRSTHAGRVVPDREGGAQSK